MNGSYDDIIHLPHPTSPRHPRMSRANRAAQFSPFAALAGHEAAIGETARVTQQRLELTEDEKERLDRRQHILQAHMEEHPTVTVRYFLPDGKKAGGAYQVVTGHLRRVNVHRGILCLWEGVEIPLNDIVALDSPLFSQLDL